jgi:hypothetical protein
MSSNSSQPTAIKSRLTLRERCGITFSLTFVPNSTHFQSTTFGNLIRRKKRIANTDSQLSPTIPPAPSVPSLPKSAPPNFKNILGRRRQKRHAKVSAVDPLARIEGLHAGLDLDAILSSPTYYRFAQRDESRCLQEIITGCYVAFQDDTVAWDGIRSKDALATPNGGCWSHIVSISEIPPNHSGSSGSGSSSSSDDPDNGYADDGSSLAYDEDFQTLRIFVPSTPGADADDEDFTHPSLTTDQLLAARDFLSFYGHALNWDPSAPYKTCHSSSSSCSSCGEECDHPPPVRLLITTPRNRRADALSVAACYLAFAFNVSVDSLLRNLNNRWACIPIWKHALDRDGVQFVESVVAM